MLKANIDLAILKRIFVAVVTSAGLCVAAVLVLNTYSSLKRDGIVSNMYLHIFREESRLFLSRLITLEPLDRL